jgi:hypothetical protein
MHASERRPPVVLLLLFCLSPRARVPRRVEGELNQPEYRAYPPLDEMLLAAASIPLA